MPRKTHLDVESANLTVVSGAQADQTIKAGKGKWLGLRVWAVGAASSKIEVYNGTVAAGTKIDDIDGTAAGYHERNWHFSVSLHVKTTDSGGAMRVTVAYL